jgi:competence protein ComEC
MVPSPARLLRDRCEINVLDLPYGGGACHIALRGGADWLIDSGSESAFRGSVHPLLRSYGSGRLDGLLLSHGDIGHVGGAVTAIQEYHPRRLLTTPLNSTSPAWRSALLAAREKGIHTESPAAGGKIDLGSGHHLHILYPPEKDAPGFVADDRCLVVQLRGPDGWRVLFMSDSGFYTERWLMENIDHDGLRSDVLVKGQHGSDYSGLPGFIDTVAPQAIIVSGTLRPASRNSLRNWKESIRDREIELFEQARSGAISIRLDAENAYITAFLDNQTLTLKRAD